MTHPTLRIIFAAALFLAAPVFANTPWTIKDENGNWIDNPACVQPACGPELPPPTVGVDVPHRDPAPLHGLSEVHKGFDCYYAPKHAWVYHAAARPNMTPEHDAAAKGEALARFERLGVAVAMTKVCRQWQINAGFKIAGVL